MEKRALIMMAYEFLSAFVPFIPAFLFFQASAKKTGMRRSKGVDAAILLFAVYVIAVYHVTRTGTLYDGLHYRLEINQEEIHWFAFSNGVDVVPYLLNVVLFLPFGVLVPAIWKKKACFFRILGAGFAFSLLIELSQLLNHRRTDVDDLILNTLGAVIGLAIYHAVRKRANGHPDLRSDSRAELPVYVAILFLGRFFLFNEMGIAKLLYGF